MKNIFLEIYSRFMLPSFTIAFLNAMFMAIRYYKQEELNNPDNFHLSKSEIRLKAILRMGEDAFLIKGHTKHILEKTKYINPLISGAIWYSLFNLIAKIFF